MTDIPDFPETPCPQREPGRIRVQDQSNDHPPLVFVHEADGSWTVHGLGAPGITLPADKMAYRAARGLTDPYLHTVARRSQQ